MIPMCNAGLPCQRMYVKDADEDAVFSQQKFDNPHASVTKKETI